MIVTNLHFRRIVVALIVVVSLCAAALAASGNNAVPYLALPLIPTSIKPGGPGFTLTVNGAGFVASSVVNWNGSPRATTFVSRTQLTASILATDIATKGTASITVSSPAPGGGVSNFIFLPVVTQDPAVGLGIKGACGSFPSVVADFNSDGKLDIANLNTAAASVSISLGLGDGTFRPKATYGTGVNPNTSATGDFNGDGKLDLAIVNAGSHSVTILLGNGDGTFIHGNPIPTGAQPESIAAGDFNEDGALDLLVVNDKGESLSILLGNGDGTFQHNIEIPLGAWVFALAIGDFNGDGHIDVAVGEAFFPVIQILLGNGDGTFQSSIPLSFSGNTMVAADFNGDGKLDLVVATGANSVSVVLGNGDGTFALPTSYAVPGSSISLATGDFEGDGSLDLAVEQTGDIGGPFAQLSILKGKGDGTFKLVSSFSSEGSFWNTLAGDFNGDGRLDVDDGCVFLQVPRAVEITPPHPLVFGYQMVGSTSPAQQVKLTSVGPQSTTISNIAATGDFAETDNCPSTLATNKGCFVTVTFTPTAAGKRVGQLVFTDDAAGSPQTLMLSGAGNPP